MNISLLIFCTFGVVVLAACQTSNLKSYDELRGGPQRIPVKAHELYPVVDKLSFAKAIIEARHGQNIEVNASEPFLGQVLSAFPPKRDVKSIKLTQFVAECDYTRPIFPTYACRGVYKIEVVAGDGSIQKFSGEVENDFGAIIGNSWLNEAKVFSKYLGRDFANKSAGQLAAIPTRPDGISVGASTGSGSGVFISHDVLISNNHVVKGCRAYTIRQGVKSWPGEIIARDPAVDLAAIKVNRTDGGFAKFNTVKIIKGIEVFISGYPLPSALSQEMKFTDGVVSALSGFKGTTTDFQISAPVQPGNSGGPVIDKHGALLGIVVAGLSGRAYLVRGGEVPQNVNFAIKGSLVRDFTKNTGIGYSDNASLERLSSSDLAQLAEVFTAQVTCNR